jgi:hypothetical protein
MRVTMERQLVIWLVSSSCLNRAMSTVAPSSGIVSIVDSGRREQLRGQAEGFLRGAGSDGRT